MRFPGVVKKCVSCLNSKEEHTLPPQNRPLWYSDCLKPLTFKKLQTQEKVRKLSSRDPSVRIITIVREISIYKGVSLSGPRKWA